MINDNDQDIVLEDLAASYIPVLREIDNSCNTNEQQKRFLAHCIIYDVRNRLRLATDEDQVRRFDALLAAMLGSGLRRLITLLVSSEQHGRARLH